MFAFDSLLQVKWQIAYWYIYELCLRVEVAIYDVLCFAA